jgi:hypothetical protein
MPRHRIPPFKLAELPSPERQPSEEEIARLAYEFWEIGGHRFGFALDDWLLAEAILTPDPEDWQE